MLSVSPSDIHYLPGLECTDSQDQTLPSDRLTVEKIIGSKATLQVGFLQYIIIASLCTDWLNINYIFALQFLGFSFSFHIISMKKM